MRLIFALLIFVLLLASTDGSSATVGYRCEKEETDAGCSGLASLRIDGPIDEQTPEQLERAIAHVRPSQKISLYLNSTGGLVAPALKAGHIVRRERLETVVDMGDHCISSCTFVFIGGVTRRLHPWSALEVHRPSLPAMRLAGLRYEEIERANSAVKAEVEAYVRAMGVSQEFVSLLYAMPINGTVELTSFEAWPMRVVGMSETEYDFRKGQLVGTYGPAIERALTLSMARAHFQMNCLTTIYRRQRAQDRSPGEASALTHADGVGPCQDRALERFGTQLDLFPDAGSIVEVRSLVQDSLGQ